MDRDKVQAMVRSVGREAAEKRVLDRLIFAIERNDHREVRRLDALLKYVDQPAAR
jgi:hypothetical protein